MTTYKWNISQTNYETANGFITTAHWQCTAVDGAYTATTYSTSSWPAGMPSIPYAEVTMADMLDWIWANGVDKADTEAALAQNIDLQKNPVISVGLPWGYE